MTGLILTVAAVVTITAVMTRLILWDTARAEQRRRYRQVAALPEFQKIHQAFVRFHIELVDNLTPVLQRVAAELAALAPIIEQYSRPTWRQRLRRVWHR